MVTSVSPHAQTMRTLVVGLCVWLVILVATLASWTRLSLIELLFLLAPWILVPCELALLGPFGSTSRRQFQHTRWIQFFAIPATASLMIHFRPASAALAACWLCVCAAVAADGVFRIARFRATSFAQFCVSAGEVYLLVGRIWLVMSRLGWHPAGFEEPIVFLTAIHFHFAGFMSALLAAFTYNRLEARAARILRVFLTGAVIGPGILGLAFLAGPKWKLLAVVLIFAGQCGLAAGTALLGFRTLPSLSGVCFLLASSSLTLGMLFALAWAIGEYPLHPWIDLARMERIHGVLNALGFGLMTVIGWAFLTQGIPARESQSCA